MTALRSHRVAQTPFALALTATFAASTPTFAQPAKPGHPPTQPAGAPAESHRFWLGPFLQGDLVLMDGGDLCGRASQTDVRYACFRTDREQYVGVPDSPPEGFAVAYGTTRLGLQLERPITRELTLGGRFGLAFGGGPTPEKGPSFLPVHLEARFAYWPLGAPSRQPGVRPFVSLAGGLAQVDAGRTVTVTECRAGAESGCAPATNEQPGGPNPDSQSLDAQKKLGQGFASLGIGAFGSFAPGSGALLELRLVQLFPGSGTSLSPSLSYVFEMQ